MRSIHHLLRRSINNESARYAYRWLFDRAQHLQKPSHSKKLKSLFGIFRSLINQYHCNVPVEYLCGTAMFFNRLFIVNRHVLIPRRDSESLIYHVQELSNQQNITIQSALEIGTGSGCLSITLARLYPYWQIHACDISSSALRVARQNAHFHHCQKSIKFHRGDLFDPQFLEHTSYDLIISNPPYISSDQLSQCDRGIFHEPSIALFADPPLKFYSKIIQRAIQGWLNTNGYLVFECSPLNIKEIQQLFRQYETYFDQIEIRLDTNKLVRVISARRRSF